LPTHANGSVAPIAPDISCALRTMRALRDEAFDVLHLHEPCAPGPTQTSVFLASAPCVGTFHAAGRSAAYQWLRPCMRWIANRLDVRCAVSEDARTLAERFLPGTYTLLFNGIEVERFAKATPWPTDGPTVLFVSRHETRKGLAVLLAAMRRLPTDVKLWVASDGPETPRLREATAGDARIHWLGRISEEEKARRLRGADVLCAPSLHGESFGLVLLEGMAASTPIVASDLPGYRNVARDGQEALLVPPGDPGALARAVTRVFEEPETARRLTAGGDARAATYSMEHLAARYLDLYEHAGAVRV
ncbi:MAG: glycosyltransferase family 4 protein, partial [Acidimicrobiales bacterium]